MSVATTEGRGSPSNREVHARAPLLRWLEAFAVFARRARRLTSDCMGADKLRRCRVSEASGSASAPIFCGPGADTAVGSASCRVSPSKNKIPGDMRDKVR